MSKCLSKPNTIKCNAEKNGTWTFNGFKCAIGGSVLHYLLQLVNLSLLVMSARGR